MNHTEKKLWSFYNSDETSFLREGMIAVDACGVDGTGADREDFRQRCERSVSGDAGFGKKVAVNLLCRFVYEMEAGDYVALRTGHGKPVDLGEVTGQCVYDEAGGSFRRSVRWLRRLPAEEISSATLREITYASASPLFQVRRGISELLGALGQREPEREVAEQAPAAAPVPASDLSTFVLRELGRQPAYRGCKEYVAGLLQAMGYRVTMLAGNEGADMVAHRDELMPRVQVKVKAYGAEPEDVETLRAAMGRGELGILVTLEDLSPETRRALDRAGVRGVDGKELTQLTLRYYADLHERYRRMIPLRTVFVPVA